MSLTYSSYVTTLANMLVVSPTDANYLVVLPNIIDDAEGRIYRELDLLTTVVRTSTTALSTSTKLVTLPSSVRMVVVNELNVYTPTGTTTTRNPLIPVALDFINTVYPTETSTSSASVPAYFAMITDQTLLVAPPPNAPYTLEIVATTRPATLSSTNTTTYLTTYLPDLFMSASMVFAAGYMKNFGVMSDDPQAGQTWEALYQKRFTSAAVEEARKKFGGPAWTSKNPNPIATPPRA